MGLFSTLASATGSNNNSNNNNNEAVVVQTTRAAPASSSATIPTVVQLYSQQQIILMEDTPNVTGYTSLTYQAVQVGFSRDNNDTITVAERKNRHLNSNPDLGVWNCRVVSDNSNNNNDPLSDCLLAKVAAPSQTSSSVMYCLTVDLSDETTVETNLSALQAALVRHLIEQPPQTTDGGDDNNNDNKIGMNSTKNKTKTTNLYDLQTAQFGLASEEKAAERTIEESAKDIKVGLMICAVVSSSSNDENDNTTTMDESSESAYKKKQARALVVYHLRKFANSIHAALCFVERPKPQQQHQQQESSSTSKESSATAESAVDSTATIDNNNNTQLAISYDRLSQLWRDMAMGVPVWEQEQQPPSSSPSPPPTETTTASGGEAEDTNTVATTGVSATALYGPGRQQEDLIESLLLRNANYPGHWDASKDSLWVALPATSSGGSDTNETTTATTSAGGDDAWLTQLRDSIASVLPPTTDKTDAANNNNEKAAAAEDGENGKPKDTAAVSSFFESLLKNP